ncbi:hypothetical protein LSUE1_G008011 [Lachnellula suecica]|uniref:Uncharacterized protein n=1 Tax=Lachnellula suecica TaxID=602035 RepID=A0A8T9C670_9HELO|nr:hypothetical protein LSUE1_G008011 [Lachnellula suecica]
MSSASTPTGAPKSMSSRLLTMKFMQRAANTSPSSSPSTPDEPPNKRRKKDTDSPSKFNVDALADQRAVQKALADEEAKRQAVLERQAAEAGDTRWVLSFEDQKQVAASSALALRVVQTGYANLDSIAPLQIQAMEEGAEDKPAMVGRRSYGKFNRGLEKQQDSTKAVKEDASESDSEEEDDESSKSGEEDDDDPSEGFYNDSRAAEATDRLRKQRKAQKHKENKALRKQGKERKRKEVDLNKLSSLSGGGHTGGGKGPCHECGGPHMKRDCPGDGVVTRAKRVYPYEKRDDGPPRKTARAR